MTRQLTGYRQRSIRLRLTLVSSAVGRPRGGGEVAIEGGSGDPERLTDVLDRIAGIAMKLAGHLNHTIGVGELRPTTQAPVLQLPRSSFSCSPTRSAICTEARTTAGSCRRPSCIEPVHRPTDYHGPHVHYEEGANGTGPVTRVFPPGDGPGYHGRTSSALGVAAAWGGRQAASEPPARRHPGAHLGRQ